VTLVLAALSATLLAVPSGASVSRAPAQGVTKNDITFAILIADIDGLKARGISTSSRSSNARFIGRWQAYFDAFGPINGRKITVKAIPWDPIDATTLSKACTAATIDTKPFLVLNTSGFQSSQVPCITVENKTPLVMSGQIDSKLLKGSGKNLVALIPPGDQLAGAVARALDEGGVVKKSQKIGILSNNEPSVKATADTLDKALTQRKFNVASKVELNGLAADVGVLGREATAAADTFKANGVDVVLNVNSLTGLGGFFDENALIGAKYKVISMDGQANTCSQSAAAATRPSAAGAECITPYSSAATPDTKFETKCRKVFDGFTGKASTPGAPAGDVEIDGVLYSEDFPAAECTIANFLLPAIKQAGKNPTWDKVYKNILAQSKVDVARMSDGDGGFAPGQPYVARNINLVDLHQANHDTPKGADGSYNGCPLPINCWVHTQLVGKDWVPIAAAKSATG
jgi:hypothetical protein